MRWVEGQRNRKWDPFFHGELNGLTVGIIGAGYSGTDLALKAKAFHMRVLGLRRNGVAGRELRPHVSRANELHAFLGECDFVVVTAPKTPETTDMLGEAEFKAMKPSAFYVCFSRGGVANDAALYRALTEGWIAGAGLDAHGVEPLPADSPFWDAPNTIVTPHNGATTLATKARGYRIFADNLRRYVAGEPLSTSSTSSSAIEAGHGSVGSDDLRASGDRLVQPDGPGPLRRDGGALHRGCRLGTGRQAGLAAGRRSWQRFDSAPRPTSRATSSPTCSST